MIAQEAIDKAAAQTPSHPAADGSDSPTSNRPTSNRPTSNRPASDGAPLRAVEAVSWHAQIPEDREMLRAAASLTRDIARARPEIYWPDMLASTLAGYALLAGAILIDNPIAAFACGVLASLVLYRALLFIHELTHMHRDALPGFRFAWNLLVGVPLLIPSFMYEGVHAQHHSRTRYGTLTDPEYLPLALMKPWSLPVFALTAILLPPALLIRSAVLVPLGVIVPPLRTLVWERASSLSINPAYRRDKPKGAFARMVFWQELGCSLWAIAVLAASWAYGWRPLVIALCVVSLTAFLNQVRTLVAHLWENDGAEMTLTAQYLDSVNVPPPAFLSPLWAPVGLRFHALHHLLPSMPYHSLGECHRRLIAHLGLETTYNKANYPGLLPLLRRLVEGTMKPR
ncbi:fatty acid desaturase [Novosphingobium sp. 1949]|uniref:Fatty acid desaturase n=1 Tax=Novosphingobium organovorum TaxID=2930092 RepID=A0ABT0BGC3_9SPHN|nr:fatty acid desaturase [Novosphingobium organovorum]MCJ2184116.1 fatty acid desaturase [Novosphingobium organovorum]